MQIYTYTTKDGKKERMEISQTELTERDFDIHSFIPDEHRPLTELTCVGEEPEKEN